MNRAQPSSAFRGGERQRVEGRFFKLESTRWHSQPPLNVGLPRPNHSNAANKKKT